MKRARGAVVASLALAFAIAGASAWGSGHAASSPSRAPDALAPVLETRLEGTVTPAMAEMLDAALSQAERERDAALVVTLNTPGGLESSMRVMVMRMLAARVPVIVWIAPGGARAASAGVFLTIAADVAAMAPGTNIGAATPINLQGPMDSTLARKATNDAAAFARTVARQRGRNAVWAEDAVRHAVAASETEALSLGVIDFVTGSLPELLDRADGRPWKHGDASGRIETRGHAVRVVTPSLRLRLLAMLSDPNIAYLLMMVGFYGILFELQNPGAILPGIIGGIALVLALFALSTLPVNVAGVALIALAVVFFVAEVKVASHGLLAAGGVLAMLLGSLMLFHGEQVRVSYGVIGGATLVTALFFLVVVGAALRAQRRPVTSGAPGMRGQHGVAVERLGPRGLVRIGGVLWSAVSEAPVEIGTEVEVVRVDGLTVTVRPRAQEATA